MWSCLHLVTADMMAIVTLTFKFCQSMHVLCTLNNLVQTWSFGLAVAASGSPSAAVHALDTDQCKYMVSRQALQLNCEAVLSDTSQRQGSQLGKCAGVPATVAQAQSQSAPEPVINTTLASVLVAQQHRKMPAATLSQPRTDVAPALPTQTAVRVSLTQPVTTEAVAAQHGPRQSSKQHAAAPVDWAVQPDVPSATVSAAASAVAALSAALAGGTQTGPSAASLPLPSVARPATPAPTLLVPSSIPPLPATTTGVSSAAVSSAAVSSAAVSAAFPATPSAAHSLASAAAASAALMTNPATIALASLPIAAQMATPVHQTAAGEPTPAAALTGQTHQSALPQPSQSSAAAAASGHADLPQINQQMPKQMPVASDAHTVAQTATSADQPTDGGALPSAYANLPGRLKPSVSMSMRPRSVAIGSKAKVPLKSGKLPIERPDLPFEPASLPFDQPLSAAQPSGAVTSGDAVAGHALQQSLSAPHMPQISLSSIPAVAAPTLVVAAAHSAGGVQQTSNLALQNVPNAASASKGRTEGSPALPMDRPEGSPALPVGKPEGSTIEPMGRADGSGAMLMGSRDMPGRQESRKGSLPALSKARDDKQSSGVAAASTVTRTSSKDKDRDRHTSQDRHRDR